MLTLEVEEGGPCPASDVRFVFKAVDGTPKARATVRYVEYDAHVIHMDFLTPPAELDEPLAEEVFTHLAAHMRTEAVPERDHPPYHLFLTLEIKFANEADIRDLPGDALVASGLMRSVLGAGFRLQTSFVVHKHMHFRFVRDLVEPPVAL